MSLVSRVGHAALLAALLAVVGCGRIGFDWLSATGAELDASFAEQDATFAQQDATIVDASFSEQDAAPLDLANPPSLAGVWSIKTVTVDSGGPVVVPRSTGTGIGVLGDFELTSTGPTTFDFKASTIYLSDNLAVDYVEMDGTLAILPDEMWLLATEDGDVLILSAILEGGALKLTWEQSDPRNNTTITPPTATEIEKNFSFTTTTAGNWNSLSIEYRDGDVFTPAACVKQTDTEYERINMNWQFDSLLRARILVTWSLYSDAGCTNQTQSGTEVFQGIGEEDGSRLQWWGSETDFGPLYVDSQLSFEGENLRIVVTDCSPTPACLDLSENHLFAPAP